MKKLLSLLATFGMSATTAATAATVVSCDEKGTSAKPEKPETPSEQNALSKSVEKVLAVAKDDKAVPHDLTYVDFFHMDGSNPEAYNFLQTNLYTPVTEALNTDGVEVEGKDSVEQIASEIILPWSQSAATLVLLDNNHEEKEIITKESAGTDTLEQIFLKTVVSSGIASQEESVNREFWKANPNITLAVKISKTSEGHDITLTKDYFITFTFKTV